MCLEELRECKTDNKCDTCSALLCMPCLYQWSNELNNSCPMCRQPFNTHLTQQVALVKEISTCLEHSRRLDRLVDAQIRREELQQHMIANLSDRLEELESHPSPFEWGFGMVAGVASALFLSWRIALWLI